MNLWRLYCTLFGHRPYFDHGDAVEVEPGIWVGPGIRYCERCRKRLPGDQPQDGDRMKEYV